MVSSYLKFQQMQYLVSVNDHGMIQMYSSIWNLMSRHKRSQTGVTEDTD